jgi:hypothetical protein
MRGELRALSSACLLSLALGGRGALAQAPTAPTPSAPGGSEASVQLFREGRALLAQGRLDEACERFRAALELRRSPGTLLNVGKCLEAKGQLLGALRAFEETAALAGAETDRAKAEVWTEASRHEIEALSARIPRLVIQAPTDAGLAVQLDGAPFRDFGAPQNLDPGSHRVVASAPGKLDFTRELTLAEGQALTLEIPALEAAPAEPLAAPLVAAAPAGGAAPGAAVAAPTEADASSSKLLPWTLVGVGGAVLAGGIVTGIVAARRASELEDDCPNHVCEDDLSQRDEAQNTALVADILMGTGLVMAGAGVTWLILTKDDDATATSFSAACHFDGCGATLRGRF